MDIYWVILFISLVSLLIERLVRKLKISNFNQRYVVVTGCDTGFGNMLAKRLDAMQFHVFAGCFTSKAVMQLTEECSQNMTAIQVDVSKDASIEQMLETVKRKLPKDKGLWAVVNNAGITGTAGQCTWQTRQDFETVLAVNFYGVAMVTNAFCPLIVKERGRVVNASSMMGRIAFGQATYVVSKYCVEAFSDVLRRELYRTGVKVCIVEPGAFKTGIIDPSAQLKRLENKVNSLPEEIKGKLREDYISISMARFTKATSNASTNVNEVVDAYIHAITAKYPLKRYLVGTDARFMMRALWLLPECASDFIINKLIGKDINKE
ncbi:17-beta-hydroxysteroid dehydrogenase type 6-like [Mercenaria mercenaria]|uniref:17-beta-hydroxysteroid dehydrogenase type 6-like n=1 Tax=Mercenaria mercenaria TaxID=6596 RepID=UPI00234ED36C|nr:17-beta-hydroxysteroid dehydrogenase type 6-like [Mercenaria mercenaria]